MTIAYRACPFCSHKSFGDPLIRQLCLLLLGPLLAFSQEHTVHLALGNGLQVSIVEDDFGKSGLKVEGCTRQALVCRIGGKPFGLAAGLPKTYVRSITVTYGAKQFVLDSTGIYDAHLEARTGARQPRYFGGECQDSSNCEFRAVLGDAATAVAVEWQVFDGVCERTVFSSDDDIKALFSKQIDPPTYEQ